MHNRRLVDIVDTHPTYFDDVRAAKRCPENDGFPHAENTQFTRTAPGASTPIELLYCVPSDVMFDIEPKRELMNRRREVAGRVIARWEALGFVLDANRKHLAELWIDRVIDAAECAIAI